MRFLYNLSILVNLFFIGKLIAFKIKYFSVLGTPSLHVNPWWIPSININIFLLKYKLSFYSDRMLHPPQPCLYWARSHRFKKQFTDQSNIGPLCANTYMEMIDSALCKWTLYGFCRLMGLEPSQKRSTPLMSTLSLASNHEMLLSST